MLRSSYMLPFFCVTMETKTVIFIISPRFLFRGVKSLLIMNYSQEELIEMIYIIGECHKNCLLASRVYRERFPNRRCPSEQSFRKLKTRFETTGAVSYEKKIRQKPVLNEENEFTVALSITEDPHRSSAEIGNLLDIPPSSVRKMLKKNKFHPYKLILHQTLQEIDFQRRMTFCQWVSRKLEENPNFFEYVLFTDEATFHNNGHVNRHNLHYYAAQNPHFTRSVDNQNRWSVNVWGGILGIYIIGPHFFHQPLNGELYLNFLRNVLPQLLDATVPLNVREEMWYQQDGAPAHFHRQVVNCLNEQYPNKWIGRNGPVLWPTRSPELTKCDYFLWGYVKDQVYRSPPTTRDNMMERITEAFRSVTPVMLANVSRAFKERARVCLDQEGRHFEHLL